MAQFSFSATPIADICDGSLLLAPKRLETRPNLQEYVYCRLTQVPTTAVPEPALCDAQVTGGGAVPVRGKTYPRLMVRVIPHGGLPLGVTLYRQVSVPLEATLLAVTPQSLI